MLIRLSEIERTCIEFPANRRRNQKCSLISNISMRKDVDMFLKKANLSSSQNVHTTRLPNVNFIQASEPEQFLSDKYVEEPKTQIALGLIRSVFKILLKKSLDL